MLRDVSKSVSRGKKATHRFRCSRSLHIAVLVCATLPFAGCGRRDGPQLGQVHGTVTLRGKPLPRATVVFRPKAGHVSWADTDANGYYELIFLGKQRGAIVGTHRVEISTMPPEEFRKEIVPAQYNSKSKEQRDVAAGKNEINFDLK